MFEIPKAKSLKEEIYIFKRRLIALANSIAFYLCRIFPVQDNLISVCTFEGKGGFGCNPKYLVEELHKTNSKYEFVWFVNPNIYDKKEFPAYIRKVPNTLWNRAYWLTRSRVWIDNYRKPFGTVKRKNQYYLNVNHYTMAIKTVGLWRGVGFSKMAFLVSDNDSRMIDDLVIDSKFCEIMCPKGLVYGGRLQKSGAPRCDILFGDRKEARDSFRKKHNIPNEAKVVMFAPTFREGAKNGKRSVFSEIWTIDFRRLLQTFETRFGNEWYLCVRVHPQLAASFEDYNDDQLKDRIINESKADDMYEILAAMDAYITDYSSACFEAGAARIPVFLYADDIKKYESDRGALFWNLATDPLDNVSVNNEILIGLKVRLPFSIATDNNELEKNIIEFDGDIYDQTISNFQSNTELVFDGKASERLANIIEQEIQKRR